MVLLLAGRQGVKEQVGAHFWNSLSHAWLTEPSVCFAASPQGVSLLGSNFSTSLGSSIQGQGALSNGQLGSHGLSNDNNDGVAFDINDFPQLSARQSATGGLQGSAGIAFLALAPSQNPHAQVRREMEVE